MGPRIRQLAVQAGMYMDLDGSSWPKWMGAEECEVAYAKFAELIVLECAGLLPVGMQHGDSGVPFERVFKEHFGVEE